MRNSNKKMPLSNGSSLVGLAAGTLPFSSGPVEIEISIITFNLFSLSVLFVFMCAVVSILMSKRKIPTGYTDMSIIMVCLLYLISTLLSHDLVNSGYIAFNSLFIPTLAYFTIRTFVTTESEYKRAITLFIVGLTVGGSIRLVLTIEAFQRVNVFGLSPIGGAALASVAMIIVFYSFSRKNMIMNGVLSINILSLFSTVSRVYMLAVIASYFLMKLFKSGRALFLLIAFFVAGFFMTTFLAYSGDMFYTTGHDKMQEKSIERIVNPDFWKHSLYGRSVGYRAAYERFLESPIYGNGFDRSHKVNHSLHAEWLEYGGMLGYIAFLNLFIGHFSRANRKLVHDVYLATGILSMLAVLMNSLFNPFTLGVAPYLLFILMGFNEARLCHADIGVEDEIIEDDINDKVIKPRVIQKGKLV